MSITLGSSTAAESGDPFAHALEAFFDSYYRLRPVNATFTGIHSFDALYPDWSPQGVDLARVEMRRLRDLFARVVGPALGTLGIGPQPEWPLIDATLADAFLEIQLRELGGSHFQRGNPSLAIGEAAFGLISLMTRPFASNTERMHSAAGRLAALPMFLEGATESLRAAPLRPSWRDKALREVDGARILLSKGVPRWVADGEPESAEGGRVLELAPIALEAVERFASWLGDAETDAGMPCGCGREMFTLLISRGHWYRGDVDAMRGALRERLAVEQATLSERAKREHEGGWPGIQAELAARHPRPDSYYDAFEQTWLACRALSSERALLTWPEYPIRYVPIPAWTRDAAPYLYYLYYRSPAPFDRLRSIEYVVTPIEELDDAARERHLRAWNDSVIKLNHVVHHGAIGHHVQNWFAYRAPSRIGRVAAVDCASRIGMFAGGTMAEGWACYATDLMDEVGFLTPYESVAEQHTRVRMLCRAIADIELHCGEMSLDETIRFYTAEVGMTPEIARGEAVKNSMFPGTASMYWLGTQGIHDLRSAVAARLGAHNFRLSEFHDGLLQMGSIPVAVAAELLLRQIPETR